MNKEWILFHLREALEEITSTIADVETNSDYGETEFEVAMAHMYNHLNTGWNSRNIPVEITANATDAEFYRWRAFPTGISMG